MSNLITLSQITDELTVDSNGIGRCSISGAARIVGLSTNSALVRHFSTDLETSKLSRILMEHGFNPTDLAHTGIPDTALALIIEYYAFEAGRYCTEQAKSIYRAFAAVGLRTTIQQLKGYKPQSKQVDNGELDASLNRLRYAISSVLGRHCDADVVNFLFKQCSY